jgi:hypothetical protein
MILQLKLSVQSEQPPVWIRLQVDEKTTFHELHEYIHQGFDLSDSCSHLFELTTDKSRAVKGHGDPLLTRNWKISYPVRYTHTIKIGTQQEDDILDEHVCTLGHFFTKRGNHGKYTSHGEVNDWTIHLIVEHRLQQAGSKNCPVCLNVSKHSGEFIARNWPVYIDPLSGESVQQDDGVPTKTEMIDRINRIWRPEEKPF